MEGDGGLKPVFAMILIQVILSGTNILYKMAMNDGMKVSILVAYRYIFATICIGPIAFFLERTRRSNLTKTIVAQSVASAFFGGVVFQNLFITGMKLTSPTFASALSNLIPAFTFILAVLLSMEKVGIQTSAGQAKVMGTIIGISGAMIITFYKGPDISFWDTNNKILKPHGVAQQEVPSGNFLLGSLLVIVSNISVAIWFIIQAKVAKNYPYPYSSTSLMCGMTSIQASIVALFLERDKSQWMLGFNVRLLTVAFAGIIGSGISGSLLAWSIRKKGPLFASIFNPLMLVIVALLSILLFGERLYVGIVLGATIIVIGLYTVLWGKGKEAKKEENSSLRALSMDSSFDSILIE